MKLSIVLILCVLVVFVGGVLTHEMSHMVFFDYAGVDSKIEGYLYRGWLPSVRTTSIDFVSANLTETDHNRMELLHGFSDAIKYNLVAVEVFLGFIFVLLFIIAYDIRRNKEE